MNADDIVNILQILQFSQKTSFFAHFNLFLNIAFQENIQETFFCGARHSLKEGENMHKRERDEIVSLVICMIETSLSYIAHSGNL